MGLFSHKRSDQIQVEKREKVFKKRDKNKRYSWDIFDVLESETKKIAICVVLNNIIPYLDKYIMSVCMVS